MDPRTEPIKNDIETIRESMTDKIGQIEDKVKGTVEGTVDSVKQTFNLNTQVGERPWAAFGVAVLIGYGLGSMGGGSKSDNVRTMYPQHAGEPMRYYPAPSMRAGEQPTSQLKGNQQSFGISTGNGNYQPQSSSQPGFLGDLAEQFGSEFEVLKTAAVSAGIAFIRDIIKENVPNFDQAYREAQGAYERQKVENDTFNGSSSIENLRPDPAGDDITESRPGYGYGNADARQVGQL
ncbi:hypothetical protein HC891_18220 [Candidatus Gracilibacteria bacterium]|nr:hypothetical protein [Candidatus Gracilibacteria bacterium]